MLSNSNEQATVRRYLLGQLSAEAREQFEQLLLTQDEAFAQLLVVEDELVDEYLSGNLDAQEVKMFAKHFLNSAERQQKLRFAKAFKKYAAAHAPAELQPEPNTRSTSRSTWWPLLTASPWQAVAVAAVILLAATAAWQVFIYRSDVDKGLIALNNAYKDQRPIEARITRLDYAPFVTTRGGEPPHVDSRERDFAERYLLDAVRDKPGSVSYHALGKFYLAEKNFDKAIAHFEEALKADPNNAQIYADLGAAWLEKGKRDASANSGNSLEELARSLENLHKALQLDPNLLDALFNRALSLQEQKLWKQAEEAWNEYLTHDSTSAWAQEARRKLAELQQRQPGEVRNKQQLTDSFKLAFKNRDDEAAWKMVSESYTSAGNTIANQLLASFLTLPDDQQKERETDLEAFSYLANLELNRAGDSYHSDVVRFYTSLTSERRPELAKVQERMRQAFDDLVAARTNQAIDRYLASRQDFERLGDSSEKVFADYRLAHSYVIQPNMEKSQEIFLGLLTQCDKLRYRWLAGQTLIGLAHISTNQNRYSDAIAFSKHGVAFFRTTGYIDGLVGTLRQLADEYQAVNKTTESLAALQESLLVAESHFIDPVTRWGLYMTVAFNLDSLGLLNATAAYQLETLEIALEIQRPLVTSRSYAYLGATFGKLKNFPEAIKNLTSAYETGANLADDPNGMDMMANSSLQLGDLYRATNESTKALEAYDLCLQVYKKLRMPYYDYAAHRGKLLTFVALQDDGKTQQELDTILSSLEQYRADINEEGQRNSFFETQQEIYDAAIHFAYQRRHDPQTAFHYSELNRARTLLDALRQSREIGEAADHEIKFSSVSTPVSLSVLQAALPADVQLVQYAVLNDKLLTWVITRDAFQTREVLIAKGDLDQKVRAFVKAVATPPGLGNSDAAAGRELYQILLEPIIPLLNKRSLVIIVPDKVLNYLPFAALQSESKRYLVEDYTLGLSPSATIFIDSSQKAAARSVLDSEKLLSVGNPSFDRTEFSDLQDLPAATHEAQAISAYYKSATVLVGENAREQAIAKLMKNADVIHLALHYVANPKSEMLSELVLAKEAHPRDQIEGQLHAFEIYRMSLPRTRLAVLSACQTGIDRNVDGEGAVGIARPFIAAGVPVVVASLWPVESNSTSELMIQFHKHRKSENHSIVEALRMAQLEMLTNPSSEYRQPYYWASFVVIGGSASS
jgi:CHAT domain-containing protein